MYRKMKKDIPLSGGCNTYNQPYELGFGRFSMVQNMRGRHPGFVKRKGQTKLHTTADGTNKVLSLYQFRKQRSDTKFFFAQMSDGDLLEATSAPPTVTTGAFGSEAHDGSAGQVPASYANVGDKLIYSNGVDQHQIFTGGGDYVEGFVVFDGAAAPPAVPVEGRDYSREVADGNSSTVAVLDSLDTYANYECVFIRTPVPVKSFTFTVSAANGNASTASIYYWKNDSTWAAASGLSDGTSASSKTLNKSGTMSFTPPTDIIPKLAYGANAFWYQLRVSAALDASVEISAVTYDSDFQDIVNVWDGVAPYAIEVWLADDGSAPPVKMLKYASDAVDLDEYARYKVYVACPDPVCGFYIDFGNTSDSSTVLSAVQYWSGTAWTSVGTIDDGTDSCRHSGWVMFPRTDAQPMMFMEALYHAYWYRLDYASAFDADVVCSIQYMPYFDVSDFGDSMTCAAWKGRAVYTFDEYSEYLYLAASANPMILNGTDYGILEAGDGRANKVVAQRNFYSEHLVWQAERGPDGGSVTLFQGYSPETWGKLILSNYIGAMNNKSVVVVDGVLTSAATEETVKTIAFWISRHGVCATDGKAVSIISDEIRNYFDETDADCIRRGYEDQHWLAYDPVYNILRMGIVSGSSATVPNVFPVFDLNDKAWYFDSYGSEISCMAIVEAGAGDTAVTVVGGGVDDGTVYRMDYGDTDNGIAIDSYIDIVLNNAGGIISVEEFQLLMQAQSQGDLAVEFYENGNMVAADSLSMAGADSGAVSRRHKFTLNLESEHIAIRLRNAESGQAVRLSGISVWLRNLEEH